MAVTVSISHRVLQAITSGKWEGQGVKGFLVGDLDFGNSESCLVLGAWQNNPTDTNELKEEIDECLCHFAGGRSVVGVVLLLSPQSVKSFEESDDAGIDREFEEVFGSYSTWLEQLGLTQMIVVCLWRHTDSDGLFEHCIYTLSEEGVGVVNIVHNLPSKSVAIFRVRADIPVLITTESDSEEQLKLALDNELMKVQNHVQAGDFLFGFDDNKVIIQGKRSPLGSVAEDWTTCKDICKHLLVEEGGQLGGRRKGTGLVHQTPVPVSLLQLSTVEPPGTLQYAPIIRHNVGSFKTTSLMLPLDVLVEVDDRLPVLDLHGILNESVARQIVSMFHCLSAYAKEGYSNVSHIFVVTSALPSDLHLVQMKCPPSSDIHDDIKIEHSPQIMTERNHLCTPEVFHFKPSCLDTPLTVVYAKGMSDHELEKDRRTLHQRLCLPLTQPVLRRSAAGLFLCQSSPEGYLINTHIGLPEPPVKSATVSLVDGYYSYHHYMQDHFDDNKWGCAYRSLQTIVSWFKYQGYTDRSIPNHKEIQQALFEVGDKDQKFVGSRQWIGSFEVSYVLDHLLGVTSKFINVNAGSELSTVGQELSKHFQTQGTPVMIGGGVFAHTILGVAYNDMTGDISFLILDPHYTGGEDLRTIQDKGWCGWKDVNFWNQTAHYNMCLPQRPSVI